MDWRQKKLRPSQSNTWKSTKKYVQSYDQSTSKLRPRRTENWNFSTLKVDIFKIKQKFWKIAKQICLFSPKFSPLRLYRVTLIKLYLFCGSQGEHGCFPNSEINIFLDYQWQIWLFLTNSFIDFIVRKMIFVIAQNLAQLRNYKYLFLKLFWDTQ